MRGRRYGLLMLIAALAAGPSALGALGALEKARVLDWWLTPDQQGAWLEGRGEHEEAARRFRDPMRRGVALFRAGEFEAAAAAFARVRSPEAAYDRGNALVMLGKYRDAIASYDAALAVRPSWREAEENRRIAALRQERLAPPESDSGGTGGMLAADEMVFDEQGAKGSTQQTVEGTQASDAELRAVWLRRVRTRPADFLRSRFVLQLARQRRQQKDEQP